MYIYTFSGRLSLRSAYSENPSHICADLHRTANTLVSRCGDCRFHPTRSSRRTTRWSASSCRHFSGGQCASEYFNLNLRWTCKTPNIILYAKMCIVLEHLSDYIQNVANNNQRENNKPRTNTVHTSVAIMADVVRLYKWISAEVTI